MKRVNFTKDGTGKIMMVEDPNGKWCLHELPNGEGVDLYRTYKCDLCDKEFTHDPLPVVDENFKVQEGVISCGCHIYTGEDE